MMSAAANGMHQVEQFFELTMLARTLHGLFECLRGDDAAAGKDTRILSLHKHQQLAVDGQLAQAGFDADRHVGAGTIEMELCRHDGLDGLGGQIDLGELQEIREAPRPKRAFGRVRPWLLAQGRAEHEDCVRVVVEEPADQAVHRAIPFGNGVA